MNWTEHTQPTPNVSYYDHVISDTPIGSFKIEWKGWEEKHAYSIALNGLFIGTEYALEDAKDFCKKFVVSRHKELWEWLSIKVDVDKEEVVKEEAVKIFKENLEGLFKDKAAQDDEEIMQFYMEVCATIALTYYEKGLANKAKVDDEKEQAILERFDNAESAFADAWQSLKIVLIGRYELINQILSSHKELCNVVKFYQEKQK